MTATATFNRGWVIVTAAIAGLLVGAYIGAYIYYAWVPADMVLRDSPPRTLMFNGQSPQYRDIYIARVATFYQDLGGPQSTAALQSARDLLGVTSGDASNEDALSMVRGALGVARAENQTDGDAGYFTQNDEFAMSSLADTLANSQPFPQNSIVNTAPAIARTQSRILGFLILVLLSVAAFGLVFLIDRRVGRQYIAIAQTQRSVYAPPVSGDRPTATTLGSAEVATASPAMVSVAPVTPPPPTPSVSPPLSPLSPLSPPQTPPPPPPPTAFAPTAVGVGVGAGVAAVTGEVPLVTFPPCTFVLGDDRFDEDFTISGQTGELLGECGASIAERLGLDSPARVTALAVWVFDKNDFQSTTKVLMTDYAFNDPTIRSKLTARGEPVLAVNNGVIEVQTSTLRVEVRVTGLQLNTDNNPPNGYFQRVTLNFTVYRRQSA